MKLISTVYAIHQKSTGHFLPMRFGTGRGYSFDIPTPDCIPRIFKSKRSAKVALNCWLQGEWKNEWHSKGYYGGLEPPDEYLAASPQKVEGRNREDMGIVELSISDTSIQEIILLERLQIREELQRFAAEVGWEDKAFLPYLNRICPKVDS